MKALPSLLFAASIIAGPALAADSIPYSTASTPAGNTVAYNAAATIISDKKLPSIPGPNNYGAGQTWFIDCAGVLTTDVITPGTLTVELVTLTGNSGATPTSISTTGAFAPPTSLTSAAVSFRGKVTNNQSGGNGIYGAWMDFRGVNPSTALPFEYDYRPPGTSGNTGWVTVNNVGTPYAGLAVRVTWGGSPASGLITFQSCTFYRPV